MDRLGDFATLAVAVVAVVGGLAAWFRWVRPRWRVLTRFLGRIDETINGRPAQFDSYGTKRAEAVPALVEQVGVLAEAVRELVSHREELEAVKTVQLLHTQQIATNADNIADLKAAYMERIANKIEGAALYGAIDTIAKNGNPEEPA